MTRHDYHAKKTQLLQKANEKLARTARSNEEYMEKLLRLVEKYVPLEKLREDELENMMKTAKKKKKKRK